MTPPGTLASAPSAAPGTSATGPYEHALAHGGEIFLRRTDGRTVPLELPRWRSAPDAADHSVLDRCHGPTLDVGCGPGRMAVGLLARGVPALGIDVAAEAVGVAAAAGAVVLRRSVFEPLPGEGRWSAALLVDGNIGIGGDPVALLGRIAQVLVASGVLVVETDAETPSVYERFAARVEDTDGRCGAPFRWARVGVDALARVAPACGFTVRTSWRHGGRAFALLERLPFP